MITPPATLDDARVFRFTHIDDSVVPTGKTIHRIANQAIEKIKYLAICQYEGEADYYLFHCDASCKVVTDTWHPTMESALEQAKFEYQGLVFLETQS